MSSISNAAISSTVCTPPPELVHLPVLPMFHLCLKAFVRQELVPATKSAGADPSLTCHIFTEIESLSAAVAQAQIARQHPKATPCPPSGPGAQSFPDLALLLMSFKAHNPLWNTIFLMSAAIYSNMSNAMYLSMVYYQITHLGYFPPMRYKNQ